MCAALTDNDTLYRCAAHRTGFTRAAINSEMVLKTTSAVNPIKAGTIVLDPSLQNRANTPEEFFSFI